MRNPIVPRNDKAPVGTARISGEANAKIKKAYKRIGQRVKILFNRIPVKEVTPDNAGISNNADQTYQYLISPYDVNALASQIDAIIKAETEDGDIITPYAVSSFNLGTIAAINNLVAQVPSYNVSPDTLQFSPAHRARIVIIQQRMFEEMQNLNGEMRANMGRILTEGMSQGKSPRAIARQIYQQVGIPEWNNGENKASYARALRVSRTEINHAHRTATRAQDQDANKMGISTGLLWFSALSATTRRTHARRHGHIYTRQEVEDFYGRDGNEIHCKCNQSSIALQPDGQPYDPEFVKRLQGKGKIYFEK